MANYDISIELRTFQNVEESACMKVGLLVMNVDFRSCLLGRRQEVPKKFNLDTICKGILQLNLGVQSIESGPCLGESRAYNSKSNATSM